MATHGHCTIEHYTSGFRSVQQADFLSTNKLVDQTTRTTHDQAKSETKLVHTTLCWASRYVPWNKLQLVAEAQAQA